VELARESGLIPLGDFRLNVTNRDALSVWRGIGIGDVVLSPELTSRQARGIGGRAIVYGRIPLMITERCFMKENFGCDKCGKCQLVDRKGIKFPMVREYDHRNLIFNSAYTYMGDRQDEAAGLSYHFIFTTEASSQAGEIVRSFKEKRAFPIVGQFRRMGKRKVE
jgi:putative protease